MLGKENKDGEFEGAENLPHWARRAKASEAERADNAQVVRRGRIGFFPDSD